jgi:hypothetical protein
LITTITRVKRIPLLALFFVSAMEFILERALIDLVLMTGALTILLWGVVRRPRHIHARLANAPTIPRKCRPKVQKACELGLRQSSGPIGTRFRRFRANDRLLAFLESL